MATWINSEWPFSYRGQRRMSPFYPLGCENSTKNNPRSAPSIAVGLVGGVARANLDLVVQYIV
jgi:hypothetical protein